MITSFSGPYRFLSNFYPSIVAYEGMRFSTVEHAYQAAKTLDERERLWIASRPYPALAKKAGKSVTLRRGWEGMKVDVMRELLAQKFTNPGLAQQLLDTGEQDLVEGNTWGDVFWGVCSGRGQNWLGKLLMERRSILAAHRSKLEEPHG